MSPRLVARTLLLALALTASCSVEVPTGPGQDAGWAPDVGRPDAGSPGADAGSEPAADAAPWASDASRSPADSALPAPDASAAAGPDASIASADAGPDAGFVGPCKNVRDYGALGDDTHDDTAAFVSAMADTSGMASRAICVPAGTYLVPGTTSLTLADGLAVVGAGADRAWIHGKVYFGSNDWVLDLKIGMDGKAFRNKNAAHDTLVERCTFVGGGGKSAGADHGVIRFHDGQSATNVRFLDCEIGRNSADGDNVAIMEVGDASGHYEGIVFERCHFLGAPCMDIEVIQRPNAQTTRGYDVKLLDSVFEPADSQTLSFDSNSQGLSHAEVARCLIKGGGANPTATNPWTQGLEINAPVIAHVHHNTFWRCRGVMLNWDEPTLASALYGTVVEQNTFDGTQGPVVRPAANQRDALIALPNNGGVFRDNTVIAQSSIFSVQGSNNLVDHNQVTDTTSSDQIFRFEGTAGGNVVSRNTIVAPGGRINFVGTGTGNQFTANDIETGSTWPYNRSAGTSFTESGNTYH